MALDFALWVMSGRFAFLCRQFRDWSIHVHVVLNDDATVDAIIIQY